jgi:hypothetical protein
MAGMDLQALKRYRDRGDPPASVFVESGTYHGATARRALSLFASVHTIELSESLAAEYHPTLAAMGINCYLGPFAGISTPISRPPWSGRRGARSPSNSNSKRSPGGTSRTS